MKIRFLVSNVTSAPGSDTVSNDYLDSRCVGRVMAT